MWICDEGGNLENGDYIHSSSVPGYGMKQTEEMLCNFTVAKIIMNCTFSPSNVEEYLPNSNNKNIVTNTGILMPEYETRIVGINGNIIQESEYDSNLHYKCAFIGCTYHCG